jgi:hypothetical protein
MSSEELIILLVSFVLGIVGSPTLIDWIKKTLGLEGTGALLLAAGASAVIGFAALFISGEIGLADFTWNNLPAAFGIVFTAATLAYRLLNPEPQS